MTDSPVGSRDPLRARRERTPERLAVIDGESGREWTYAEFDGFVEAVGATLVDAGVDTGVTVATLLDSRPLTAALPFATIRLGATLAPLNVELDRETLAEQIDRLDPALVICTAETESMATNAAGSVRSIDSPTNESLGRLGNVADDGREPERAHDHDTPPGIDPDETAVVVFTSGTTGRPKGVRLTLENLRSSAVASATRLGVTPGDRWLSPLATYHVGGIAPFVRSTLYGTTAILQREFDADATAHALDHREVTCVSLVPTMLRRLLDAGWRPGPDLRFVLLGGGPASTALVERCLDLGVPVCPTYGASETASQVATATPGDVREDPGTVGRPLRDTTVRIVRDRERCDPGETGELVVEGPTVSPGYLDSSASGASFEDGAFRTGDLGGRDEDGRLRVVGRVDDVVVTGGENVRPSRVASAIEDHPAVSEAAVVGVPDEEWGERVVALVVREEALTADELREWLRGRIPAFARPKSIAFARTLPRTASGTIDRAAVRERFE